MVVCCRYSHPRYWDSSGMKRGVCYLYSYWFLLRRSQQPLICLRSYVISWVGAYWCGSLSLPYPNRLCSRISDPICWASSDIRTVVCWLQSCLVCPRRLQQILYVPETVYKLEWEHIDVMLHHFQDILRDNKFKFCLRSIHLGSVDNLWREISQKEWALTVENQAIYSNSS